MDYREHLCSIDNPINFQKRRIIEFSLINSFLIIVSINQSLLMCFIESIDFILHVFSEIIDLLLCEPICMKIASSFIFDKIFIFLSILSFSFPQNLRDFYIEDTKLIVFLFRAFIVVPIIVMVLITFLLSITFLEMHSYDFIRQFIGFSSC